eukprot:753061-Hanusia_phi.AAC.3
MVRGRRRSGKEDEEEDRSRMNDQLIRSARQFRHITVGGAIAGIAGESGSFRHGFFHDAVRREEREGGEDEGGKGSGRKEGGGGGEREGSEKRGERWRGRGGGETDLLTELKIAGMEVVLGDGNIVTATADNEVRGAEKATLKCQHEP